MTSPSPFHYRWNRNEILPHGSISVKILDESRSSGKMPWHVRTLSQICAG